VPESKDPPIRVVGGGACLHVSDGKVWGGNHYGPPWYYDIATGKTETFSPDWASTVINTRGFWGGWCATEFDGKVWAGNFWGVAVMDTRTRQASYVTTADGLASNQVLCLTVHEGKLWLGC